MAAISFKRLELVPPPEGGLTEATATHKYRSKNGLWYDQYQTMVNANIADNKNQLRTLGLMDDALKPGRTSKLMLKDINGNDSPRKQSASAGPVRRSNRKRNVGPENSGLTDDDFNDALRRQVKKSESATSRKVSRVRNDATTYLSLSEEHRAKLATIPRSQWADDMREYLLREERLSDSNCASVMRQVTKLASGVGITYARWPEGVAFGKNLRVTMGSNFYELLNDAVDFENAHGADLGNGWLLRHPIKKLNNFQQHLLEKLLQSDSCESTSTDP